MSASLDEKLALAAAAEAADRKEWERAADLLAEAGDSTQVLDKRSFYLSRAKRYDEALELLRLLRERAPQNFLWFYMTGYQYSIQERFAESLPWFHQALERNRGHIKSWWRAANALARTGEERKAIECAARVLRLWHALPEETKDQERSSFGKASYLLGKLQMRNDPHGAVELLEQARGADPKNPHRNYRLGKALRCDSRASEALPYLRRAAKLKPGDTNIELELAVVLARTGEAAEAEAIIRRLERRLRGWDLLKAGTAVLELERPHLAVALLERAVGERGVRGNERLEEQLAKARAAAKDAPSGKAERRPERQERPRRPREGGEPSTGRVEVVNDERNFGFLVDEAGTRRHFRLSGLKVRRGQRVRFTPLEANKGPAAREIKPL